MVIWHALTDVYPRCPSAYKFFSAHGGISCILNQYLLLAESTTDRSVFFFRWTGCEGRSRARILVVSASHKRYVTKDDVKILNIDGPGQRITSASGGRGVVRCSDCSRVRILDPGAS